MLPDFLLTVTMPSWTVHWAGDLSLTVIHWSRLWPSKRMMASEGGAGKAAGPGVTTLGMGCQTSVSSGLGLLTGLASSAARARRGKIVSSRNVRVSLLFIGFSEGVLQRGKGLVVESALV